MTLIGNVYIQDSHLDPGAVGFGYVWRKTDTGDEVRRNTSNTAWILAGNNNQTYKGWLNRAGGIVTGAILGKHGIIPLAGGDFSAAPTINSLTVAAIDYVDERDNYVLSQIPVIIQTTVASRTGISITNNFSISYGDGFDFGFANEKTVPNGWSYADGTPISVNEGIFTATMSHAGWAAGSENTVFSFGITGPYFVDQWSVYSLQETPRQLFGGQMVWIGFAIRPGS